MSKQPPNTSISCDRCDCAIPPSDLQQGLAIRIAKEVVCAACVDSLPSNSQVKINQIRAMRGMDSTTYRIKDPLRPQTQVYTFSTSTNLIRHRHSLRSSGRFEAPLLCKDQRTVSRSSELAKLGRRSNDPSKATFYLATTITAVVVLSLAIIWLAWPGTSPQPQATDSSETTATDHNEAYAEISKTFDPVIALDLAKNTYGLPADDPVVIKLFKEIIEQKNRELDAAEETLKGAAFERGKELVTKTELPENERRLFFLKDRQRSLLDRIARAEQHKIPDEHVTPEKNIAEAPTIPAPKDADDGPIQPSAQIAAPQIAPNEPTANNATTATNIPSTPADENKNAATSEIPAVDPSTLTALQSPFSQMLRATPKKAQEAWEEKRESAEDYRLKLTGAERSTQPRTSIVTPGKWEIWVMGHSKNPSTSINATFGTAKISYDGGKHSSNRYDWFRISEAFEITEETTSTLFLNFASQTRIALGISAIY